MIQKFSLFALLLIVLTSCGHIRDMQVRTTRPAYITLDASIKKLVIVNRSKQNQKPIINQVLAGQIPGNSEVISKECISSILQTLNNSNRFTAQVYTKSVYSSSESNAQTVSFLSWADVQQICAETNADAVLALDNFESDYKIINVSAPNSSTAAPNTLPVLSATGTASANGTFRIYDAHKKEIAYDHPYQTNHTWTETASNYFEAVAKLAKRNDALKNVSNQLGNRFAGELIPTTSWEARLMYKGKTDLTKKAERQALTNNWEDAAKTWEDAYNATSDVKTKGNIAYNLALAYEVIGNLDKAKSWINKSYIDSGNKKALSYSNTIDGLISEPPIFGK